MDVTHILDPLNDRQREAVAAPTGSVLVLAGAGSGKTRVLTHRAAWLIEAEAISPHGLLAVTFTNKAANEMRGRIEHLLGASAGAAWVGTFHGLCHRFLRMHWQEAGLPQSFQILDSDDQQRVIKRVIRGLDADENRWVPREVQWFINNRKDEGLRSSHLHPDDETEFEFKRIYAAYEETCERGGMVDFAELLLRVQETLVQDQALLGHYQRRFRHLLVDEFQDTNEIQYAWLKLLAGGGAQPFVVGDDDQSIYRWRGAKVENLQRFQQDFPGTQVVRLEQNYRSTGNILAAANGLITHNAGRLGKELWTEDSDGSPVRIFSGFDERDEADFVLDKIKSWVDHGGKRADLAVLYRSNAQSRVFEEAFINERIPYRVYGGLRFFERQEVKDALAYLRLVQNRDDDASFERVVNLPTRGIGNRTVEMIRDYARANTTTLWRAAGALVTDGLSSRASNALRGFMELIEQLAAGVAGTSMEEHVEHVISTVQLEAHYRAREKGERGEARVENLGELINAARGFQYDEEEGLSPMDSFLAHAALEAGDNQAESWEDCVQMMTLHSAKGLEFPVVFMCGMEDGLFPHQRTMADPEGLEEERRLCYVGMTRAMRELYLCYAEQRRMHGMEAYAEPSRFLGEIPPERMEEVRPRMGVSRPVSNRFGGGSIAGDDAGTGLTLGRRVGHAKFGEGVVVSIEGHGAHARVQVNFESEGIKWLVLQYANLKEL
jgi:DNA helicase-2/ATP-dependent DNA helicase PcrA